MPPEELIWMLLIAVVWQLGRVLPTQGVIEVDYPAYYLECPPDETISTIHHILRSSRRRLVIVLTAKRMMRYWIYTNERPHEMSLSQFDLESETVITVRQLARRIVAIEQNVSENHATGDDYHNMYTSLIQTHLPKLDSVAAISYNEDRKWIVPDKNLLALASITVATTPLAQMLFYTDIAEMQSLGQSEDSITD